MEISIHELPAILSHELTDAKFFLNEVTLNRKKPSEIAVITRNASFYVIFGLLTHSHLEFL